MVSLLLKARGVVSNILTLVLVFSTLASAQTGQTVGVGVATGQNTTLLQVAGGEPVKPTTTTTSLQPGNTGANNTNKTKPAANPPHTTQLPAGINRTTITDLVTSTTTTDKTEYYPGEAASIQVSFRYNEVEYPMVQDIQSAQDFYTAVVNFTVQLPAGFAISQETLTKGPFTRDCTNRRECQDYQWNYNAGTRRLTGSFPTPTPHYKDGGEYQLFEELNITGTVTGTPNTSHTVRTTADGVLDFTYIDKTNSRAYDVQEYFTATPSQAVFQIVPRKTTLTASFQPVGLTEGQVVVTGEVLCINPQGQSDRRNIMFTLKHNQLVGGKWDRVLNNMVDAGSTCVITIVKGAVPAGWRWKTPDRITQTESNITSSRTSTIRLEVEKIPVEVSTETTATPTVAAGQQVQVISTIKASGNPALNVPVTIQLPKDGFVNTAATVNSACQATGRGAMCPARWVYNAASHTVTATIPRIPAGGSVTVTVTGEAGLFEANRRSFTATTSAAFTDANQNNNRSQASFNVTNKRVTVSLIVKPEGERPASGVVTVTGSINCVTPFQHNNTFTYTLNYARLVNGAGAPQVIHKIVWAGSNCTVTVRNTTAPNGWEFTSQTPFAYQLQQVMMDATVQHTVRLQRKFMAVAPPLPLTGGVASDWLYLTGAGVLVIGVAAGLVVVFYWYGAVGWFLTVQGGVGWLTPLFFGCVGGAARRLRSRSGSPIRRLCLAENAHKLPVNVYVFTPVFALE
ncbi:hypothetical protein KJY78_05330 [Canibacter sp. lx-45]|uniref:DUF11 domain-containing protein n=1 Tax=Canibacter zhuwentaonis TaxID=2837491 RepID=UPI001BDDA4CD|nr:DUF11 domain-containing protein [Canibacter zhuwentaonis]MBT1035765.1 hypothetical protein [Canibacter zhuwentaonis]